MIWTRNFSSVEIHSLVRPGDTPSDVKYTKVAVSIVRCRIQIWNPRCLWECHSTSTTCLNYSWNISSYFDFTDMRRGDRAQFFVNCWIKNLRSSYFRSLWYEKGAKKKHFRKLNFIYKFFGVEGGRYWFFVQVIFKINPF